MQDEIEEVLRLVAQPLKSRLKLLSGECKFALNSTLLYKINKVLDVVVNDTVDIILSEWQRKQLQLLLNLINNTPKLVITQRSAESYENVINISRFKRLRYLELCRLCLELVVGLESLKVHLETFICNRCTKYTSCLCKQKELEWPELKFLDLRHMRLDSINSRFFVSKPWIQILDLSFNRLSSIEGLEYLDHLTCLNVSYNHLITIPELSKDAEKRLEMLIINNNYISSISGLEKLSNLKCLFVNNNFISDKKELLRLNHLKSLSCVQIDNNPVSTITFWNIYVASSLSSEINIDKFLLNNKHLNKVERSVVGRQFGICCHHKPPDTNPSVRSEPAPIEISKYRRPGKRINKPREVLIEDIVSDDTAAEQATVPENKSVLSKKEKDLSFVSQVFSANEEVSKEKEDELIKQLTKSDDENDVKENNLLTLPSNSTLKEDEVKILQQDVYKEEDSNCQDSDTETTTLLVSATVHAPDSCSIDIPTDPDNLGNNRLKDLTESEELNVNENVTSGPSEKLRSSPPSEPVNEKTELEQFSSAVSTNPINSFDDNQNIAEIENESNENRESTVEFSDDSLSDAEDEVFWQVQCQDKASGKVRNLILVLLDNELKERSTETGRTLTRWSLEKIQSCTKTKLDPVTIEIEFDTTKKDKQNRIYIMEYPDAQVLLKKVYSVLESKPLTSMNQRTYECIKCGSYFVRSAPSAFKSRDTLISCAVCLSTLVIEVEEPKLPETKSQNPGPPQMSHSSSQSSIGSAASLEQTNMIDRRLSTPHRYESDIEVISNPSQSSIEVLGEHSRSVTPRRKISTEEKTGPVQITSQLTTVIEVNSPSANLTESSSSGSLTESVITAYEAFNNNKKPIIPDGILPEEESSPTAEPDPPPDDIEEEKPTWVWRKESDIYSFTDFTDVDQRIKLFLYQNIFQGDNEALLLLAKCHLWRTGGSDYDGCAVFTTTRVYFLSHSRTNFNVDICDWLTLFDSFNLSELKEISPLIWLQGIKLQFKHISYLILLMDQSRTSNLLKHLRGYIKGVKIQNNSSSSAELSLQQAVLLSSSIEKSLDPTVNAFTMCLSITILKDNVETDILRLGGLVLTSGEFHVLVGELTWLTTNITPSIVASQQMSNLMEVEKGHHFVSLHFLDEKEAMEEVWRLNLICDGQVSFVIESIQAPWEEMFSEALDVTVRS